MRFKTFTYPVPPPEELEELNAFLASTRILSVSQHQCTSGNGSCLVFVVEYLEGKGSEKKTRTQPRVDYRETLSEQDFALFSQLRDLRKEIADKEGVPVYAVFTNAQLAEMVKKRTREISGLEQLEGVGKSKIDKYGKKIIRLCQDIFTGPNSGKTP